MKADDLILFSQVIELGSFSKVAEKNNLTNSVVSKRIARLEQNAGTQLLYRTTRKLSLTEAGKILLNKAKNVTQATEEAKEAVSGFGENITGRIKMSVPTISGELVLADAVAEFCNKNTGLSIDMSLDNRFVDLIAGGYDLVIRTGYLEDSSLIARHIIDSQWVVCASPTYIAKNGKLNHPRELINHNCLQYAYQTTGACEWEFKGDQGHYIIKVSGGFSTNNASALRRSAIGGHGLAYVPRCLVYQDFINGDLIDIFPDQVGKKLGIYAVYPFTRQPPNKVRLLIEHIRQRYLEIEHCF
ncbi:LysR family transcriptional regulator [Vibrio ezurae]|uniref:Putative LysR family transcriptional regulator n=1 Tax=Vibrio ezurae NBRC 102218 TaxID=1219080 RepID=U3B2D0_9VIBR|nr:LysR family transcriptional regulator [Vibrio ezurae]GAD79602.1 putative LysR family transcriptional regulator [Vibrio ezurae NBRC 102218]